MHALARSLSRIALAAFAIASFLATGCTQVQVDPDTRGAYRLGELQVFADRDFTTVYDASKRAIADAKLFQTRDDRKVVEAELNARDSADTMVIVKIKEVGPNRTSVKIRYGVVRPDLAAAQRLYQAIERRL